MIWAAALALAMTGGMGAQNVDKSSPVGEWKTVDDATGRVKAIVKLWEQNGKLYGMIEKTYSDYPTESHKLCTACSGAQKNQPMNGLRIVWEMQRSKDGWSGGKIMDPETGKVYGCQMTLENNGAGLKVRGFLGFSMLGRTQHWSRS